jgi:hypothetical protein
MMQTTTQARLLGIREPDSTVLTPRGPLSNSRWRSSSLLALTVPAASARHRDAPRIAERRLAATRVLALLMTIIMW